jgi:predicted 3-demethylubiquinone-9 3-methyltransferase (glyoxalase superfamily)
VSQKITPFLWFDSNAEEAGNFYVSVFPNSEITEVSHYGEAGPMAAGSVMVVTFQLDGRGVAALNGGPEFTFNEAISFLIDCQSQAEVNYYWDKLTDGVSRARAGG